MDYWHLCREPVRKQVTGEATSSWYTKQKLGLAPRPIQISSKRVAWIYGELLALNKARAAGKSGDEIRTLVAGLVAARRTAA